MKLHISWRDALTGKEGVFVDEFARSEDGTADLPFTWAEGNNSCDCNRGSKFLNLVDAECGETRFEITGFTWGDEE